MVNFESVREKIVHGDGKGGDCGHVERVAELELGDYGAGLKTGQYTGCQRAGCFC